MSKRNTTGLPKKKKLHQADEEQDAGVLGRLLGAQYESREERDAHLQRLIFLSIGVVGGILVIAILAAILWETVIVPQRTVATVNGESISISQFQERVRLERTIINQRFYNDIPFLQEIGLIQNADQILQQEPYSTYWGEITDDPAVLGARVLNDMIDEQIIRQEAAARGIEVDEAVVEEEIETFFNLIEVTEEPTEEAAATAEADPTSTPTPFVSPTPTTPPTSTPPATPTPLVTEEATAEVAADATEEIVIPTSTPRPTDTPSPTPSNEERREAFNETVDEFYSEAQDVSELDRETVRSYFEYQALLRALEEEITADVDRMAPFVNARHILVATEEEAQQVITALEEGESFADLARAVSTDTGSGARGGELGWSAASNYVPPFAEAVTNAEIGEIVGPVESDFGFHIIQVRAREERELSDNEFDRAKATAFNEWLEEVTSEENNEIERRDNWPAHVPDQPQFDPFRVIDPEDAA